MGMGSEVQATEEIIRLLELAKKASDRALDETLGIFAVINDQGDILRANFGLADLLGATHDTVIQHHFFELFDDKNLEIFKRCLSDAEVLFKGTSGEDLLKGVSSEIDAQHADGRLRQYLMSFRAWSSASWPGGSSLLYTITGSDVTELKQISEQKARMEMELESAGAVQRMLLPDLTANYGSLHLSCYYTPASESGGDLLHHKVIGDELVIWIGDVTGHGVSSAMVASGARAAISVIESMGQFNPASALSTLNRTICEVTKGVTCMTFAVVSINLNTLKCRYSYAGHEGALLFRAERYRKNEIRGKKDIEVLISRSSVQLGFKLDASFDECEIQLEPGDILFGYSDGLTESQNPQGDMFKERRVVRAIGTALSDAPKTDRIISEVESARRAYCGDDPQKDDITFWALKC